MEHNSYYFVSFRILNVFFFLGKGCALANIKKKRGIYLILLKFLFYLFICIQLSLILSLLVDKIGSEKKEKGVFGSMKGFFSLFFLFFLLHRCQC